MERIELAADELEILIQHYRKPLHEETRLRSHAIILIHKQYTISGVADILMKSEETVDRWIRTFRKERISSVFPKYLNNEHAAKLTRTQKIEIGTVLSQPPSAYGIPKEFWDISSLKTYVKAEFGVEYESDESYRLLFRLHNYSFHLPDTFDRKRDEEKIRKRMDEINAEIEPYMKDDQWIVFTADECRIIWETIIRRLWLPKGKKSIIKVERKRRAQSFLGLLNLKTGADLVYRLAWQRQDEIIPVLEAIVQNYPDKRICIIWDNARFHKGKKIRERLQTTLRSIHLINLPAYAPDHNPQEHVWKYGKDKLANNQRESLEETIEVFESIIMGRKYLYRFS
ncbi:MAG TPA: IS630 family transposase [Patescibacteria group bacterium]|nr:IS630 family transposase [Patescibacteria group bacterium]